MNWAEFKFSVLLFGIQQALRFAAWRYPEFAGRLV